jgi:transposase, IS5 family
MRKAFDRQGRLDCPSVSKVVLNFNCRNETVPILRALQHIYSTPKVRDAILRSIARDVNGTSSAKHGRPGLSYWEILVLAATRLGCGYDYDQLQDLAENHRALRQVMGMGDWEGEKDKKRLDWRRIESNVNLLRPETIEQINQAIIQEGHRLAPKAAETVRGDSFVVETNVHYPTDSRLIADGLRKVLGLAVLLAGLFGLHGWRQHKHLYRKARKLVREIERIAARKGNGYQERMKRPYRELLKVAEMLLTRADTLRETVRKYGTGGGMEALAVDQDLETFLQRTRQVCNLARRRVLEGETIPHHEKLFSIFETHTQLYKRGKAGEPVQFGRLVLVFEDGAGFITHHHLLPRDQGDRDVVVEQTRTAQKRHGGKIRRGSFDRGFHSPQIQDALAKILEHPCVPMPGSKQAAEQERTASVEFRRARQSHPGIESAIGALQAGNGLKRCRDRTEKGFERYIGLGVLGRNLHVLGKLLIAREAPHSQAAYSRRKQVA